MKRDSISLVAIFALLGLYGFVPAPARAQTVEWIQRLVTGPSARVDHAMAYDSARGVTVLFGGYHANGFLADTWEWDGTSWTQRLVTGPSSRWGHGMVYDSARGVTVLFAGFDGNALDAQTWEWDGTNWTQRMVAGPPALWGHAMAYDTARGVTVFYGGGHDSIWEWDGTSWTQRLVIVSPPSRYSHAMVYDAARGVSVLHGGIFGEACTDSVCYLDDTWEWDGMNWTERLGSRPSGDSEVRHGSATAYDAARAVTVLFAGYVEVCTIRCHSYLTSDTWEWDGTNWTQRVVAGATARAGHAMAYDSARQVTVLFGGADAVDDLADTWELGVPACDGDLNGDGAVSLQDLAVLLAHFGTPGGATYADGDLDADGDVDIQDLANLLASFGSTCP